MTPAEVAKLLAKCAAYDQRTVGEADVMAWHEILERVEFDHALEAVKRHYSTQRDRAMPADILRISRVVRDERREHSEPLALPSRFETDEERDARMREGVAKVREAIAPVVAKLAIERSQEWQKSKRKPGGAWWEDDEAREEHARKLLTEMGRLHIDPEEEGLHG